MSIHWDTNDPKSLIVTMSYGTVYEGFAKSELDLIREIESDRLERLDEDELLALHKLVSRARNRHVKNYRRRGTKK